MVDDKAQEEAAKDKSQMLLSDFISMLMEEYKQWGQPTYLHLRASRAKFEKFRPGARLCDMDKKFCVDYAGWLQSEPLTPQGKPLAQATAFSSFWILGIILSAAWQKRYIKNNPWKSLSFQEKIARPESKREFLTFEEIRKLEQTPYIKENIRKAFLFACYCGLRVGDVTDLRWRDISVNGGRHFVSVVMQKNSKPISLPSRSRPCHGFRNVENRSHRYSSYRHVPTCVNICRNGRNRPDWKGTIIFMWPAIPTARC